MKERLRRAGENYEDSDSNHQSNDTAWTGTESGAEESGDDDMDTERNAEEDDGLPFYSVEDQHLKTAIWFHHIRTPSQAPSHRLLSSSGWTVKRS